MKKPIIKEKRIVRIDARTIIYASCDISDEEARSRLLAKIGRPETPEISPEEEKEPVLEEISAGSLEDMQNSVEDSEDSE